MDDERANTNDTARPADETPFGYRRSRLDVALTWGIRLVLVAVIGVGGWLGWTYYRDSQVAKTGSQQARAVQNLRNMVASRPSDAVLRERLGEALLANGQRADAVVQFEAALKIDPAFTPALSALGIVAMDQREWKKAEGYQLKIISLLVGTEMASKDVRLANAYYDLGTTLVEERRYEEAVANLKESLRIKRDSSPAHYMLSVAYGKLGLVEEQKKELAIVVAFDPKQAQANYDLGAILVKQGDLGDGAELLRIAADNAPEGVALPVEELAKLGPAKGHLEAALRIQKSDPKKALAEARAAAAIDPTFSGAVRLVAVLWEKKGDKVKALNAWERLLELVPGDRSATDAIQRLSPDAK
jgi:tetratricopeptide (TPR) repeat protein